MEDVSAAAHGLHASQAAVCGSKRTVQSRTHEGKQPGSVANKKIYLVPRDHDASIYEAVR